MISALAKGAQYSEMKISEQWLREWVSPKLDTDQLAERLTLAGLEVSALEPAGPDLTGVVVGEVCSVEPHPRATGLKICRVGVGRARLLTIVCGAPNVATGLRAPIALVGTTLPGGTTVSKADISGTESQGMLCSAAELGLAESSEGLMVLDPEAVPGQSLRETLRFDDTVFDIELTPNRGDCLSVAGIAREVAALTGARLHAPNMQAVSARTRRDIKIRLQAQKDCPHYVGRAIEDIDQGVPTPAWMVERLRRSGMRRVSAVVDVTNYVMLELGQPMHAFDLDKLTNSIRVRQAAANETLKVLDGTEVRLEAGTLLITDDTGPVALAGIMGGSSTAVGSDTCNLLLESAFFRPQAIAGRARRLGLQSESSYRFERGVDPQLQRKAIERATVLLREIAGGRPGPVVDAKIERYLPKRPTVALRQRKITQLLDQSLPSSRIERTLNRLAMRVRKGKDGWRVTPPSYRFDIEREVDLIEEIARVHGYENLPSKAPQILMCSSFKSECEIAHERFKLALVDRDYQEVITYSFVDPELQSAIEPRFKPLMLVNPISADMAAMRVSLWPGLLQAIAYNANRQQERVRVFELGRSFVRRAETVAQDRMLAGAVLGSALPPQWGVKPRESDFFDVKRDVEALLQITGRVNSFDIRHGTHPALHPGQSAQISCQGNAIGWLGGLHPDLVAKLGLNRPVFLFELQVSALQRGQIPQFGAISKFPAIRRDLALLVDVQTSVREVTDTMRKAAGELLVDLQLFDEYRGEGIDSGRKSLALALTLQDSSRTLKDEVVDEILARVVRSLQSELGAELRTK